MKIKKSNAGFSMIEVLVTLAIMGVIAATALPSISNLLPSFARNNALNQLDFDLQWAQASALSEGTRVVVELGERGDSYGLGYDYLPYSDPAAMDNSIVQKQIEGQGITVTTDKPIIFNSRGYAIAASGTLTEVSVMLHYQGITYCMGTIFTVGNVRWTCV